MTWLVALASLYGHDPRDAREWPLQDLQRLEIAHHVLREQHPFWEA